VRLIGEGQLGQLKLRRQSSQLIGLLYERSAPIMAAIAITIDFGAEAPS